MIIRRRARGGTTLVELIVVLAIISFFASIAVLAFRTDRKHNQRTRRIASLGLQVTEARRTSLRSGHAVTVAIRDSASVYWVTGLPDGSIIADASLSTILKLDPLLGQTRTDSTDDKNDVARWP